MQSLNDASTRSVSSRSTVVPFTGHLKIRKMAAMNAMKRSRRGASLSAAGAAVVAVLVTVTSQLASMCQSGFVMRSLQLDMSDHESRRSGTLSMTASFGQVHLAQQYLVAADCAAADRLEEFWLA
jgi:hypothetical protein